VIRPQPKPVRAPKARKPLLRKKPMREALPRRITRPGPGSDPVYLAKVRRLKCAKPIGIRFGYWPCGGDIVAHHAGPKSNDSTAVPLCVKHHAQWHDANGVFKGWDREQRRAWAAATIAWTRMALGWP
jgi:hypothetical protein